MIVLVVVLAYFYAHIDKNSYIYDRTSDTGTFYGTGILQDDENLQQSFVAMEDRLDGIYIKVAVSGNVENVILKYELIDTNENTVASGKVVATKLKNNKFNKLKFPQVVETKGKQYTLVLSEENADEQNGIGFYIEPGKKETQKLLVKGNETDGILVTRTFSHQFDVETFVVVLGMIAFIVVFMKVLYKYFK